MDTAESENLHYDKDNIIINIHINTKIHQLYTVLYNFSLP